MCFSQQTPKLPPTPVAPPAAKETAQSVGQSREVIQRERLDPSTLKRFSLRIPGPFSIPTK